MAGLIIHWIQETTVFIFSFHFTDQIKGHILSIVPHS